MNPLEADLEFIDKGLAEIFGSQAVTLTKAFSEESSTVSKIKQTELKDAGEAESAGLCQRAGRAAFQYWLRKNGGALGWQEMDFRLLPLRSRIRRVITDLLSWLEKRTAIKVSINETSTSWQISTAGLAAGDCEMDCNFFCGLLQEAVCWSGGGKFHVVREMSCQSEAAGHCVFEIDKQASG